MDRHGTPGRLAAGDHRVDLAEGLAQHPPPDARISTAWPTPLPIGSCCGARRAEASWAGERRGRAVCGLDKGGGVSQNDTQSTPRTV